MTTPLRTALRSGPVPLSRPGVGGAGCAASPRTVRPSIELLFELPRLKGQRGVRQLRESSHPAGRWPGAVSRASQYCGFAGIDAGPAAPSSCRSRSSRADGDDLLPRHRPGGAALRDRVRRRGVALGRNEDSGVRRDSPELAPEPAGLADQARSGRSTCTAGTTAEATIFGRALLRCRPMVDHSDPARTPRGCPRLAMTRYADLAPTRRTSRGRSTILTSPTRVRREASSAPTRRPASGDLAPTRGWVRSRPRRYRRSRGCGRRR